MRVLVTGSAGHLGEALVRTLRAEDGAVTGLDLLESPFTDHVGDIRDVEFVERCVDGHDVVMHCATLHKPHVATHSQRAFVETNVIGTVNVLEAALARGVSCVIFTSTTSVYGGVFAGEPSDAATWVTEDFAPKPKNIYGITKRAAEDVCELFHRTRGLPIVVLRTSRFFPEDDDDARVRRDYENRNLKANEFLYRRLDVSDNVDAHLLAAERGPDLGFRRYILSATTPFTEEHLERLAGDAPGVVRELCPGYEAEYERRGWKMAPHIDRVYVNRRARDELGWRPRYDFQHVLDRLRNDDDVLSPLAAEIGCKGYHAESFEEGPYPVENED